MSKSAAGTQKTPGRNVRQKSGLNKAILDQGWGEFRRQLDYKLAWKGGDVIRCSRQHTPVGHAPTVSMSRQRIVRRKRKFGVSIAATKINADLVGAINILERGHRLLACGESARLGHSVKQEPAEVSQLS